DETIPVGWCFRIKAIFLVFGVRRYHAPSRVHRDGIFKRRRHPRSVILGNLECLNSVGTSSRFGYHTTATYSLRALYESLSIRPTSNHNRNEQYRDDNHY